MERERERPCSLGVSCRCWIESGRRGVTEDSVPGSKSNAIRTKKHCSLLQPLLSPDVSPSALAFNVNVIIKSPTSSSSSSCLCGGPDLNQA